jgi:hypothetical protein
MQVQEIMMATLPAALACAFRQAGRAEVADIREKQRSEVDIGDGICGLLHIVLVIISISWQSCVAYVGQTDKVGWKAISTPLPALSTCVELASGGAHKPSGASLHGSLGLSCIGEVEVVVQCLV